MSDRGLVVDLRDAADCGAGVVGAKAANLSRLAAAGFRVPDGFVVTTAACARILLGSGDQPDRLTVPAIPLDVWAQIQTHLDRLGTYPVAVRSSGTAEDLADASCAGQYETVLGVDGRAAVVEAIGRCLASADTERVRAYANSDARVPMAVLIQRMVPAESAGVAFTANPVTGDTEVLVSAVKGLGDRLVSGAATPEEWVVRGERASCLHSVEAVLDHSTAGRIAGLAREIEQYFGSPQDVEWALSDDEVHVLQARPITALPVAPHVEAPTTGYWQKDTSHCPMPLTAFGASVYLPTAKQAFPVAAAEFGLLVDGLDWRCLGGEVYFRAIPLGDKERPTLPPWVMWAAARLAPPLRRRSRAARTALCTGLPDRLLDAWDREWRTAYAEEARALRGVELGALDDEAVLVQLDRRKDLLRRGLTLHFRLGFPHGLALHELATLCRELLGWDMAQVLSLLAGTSPKSSEPGRALRDLAQHIGADPLAAAAVPGPAGELTVRLGRSAPWAAAAFAEYLDSYGHRPLSHDPGDPTWFEQPGLVAGLLAEQVRESASAREADRVPEVLEQARAALTARSTEDRDLFERTLVRAQRGYGNREDNVFFLDGQPSALLRHCALAIGGRLVARGVLACAGDAVHLTETELRAALRRGAADDLRPLVARRKAQRVWAIAHPGPPSFGTDPGAPDLSPLPAAMRLCNTVLIEFLQLMDPPHHRQHSTDELRGVPGSPGRYTGTVRVIRDETGFGKLRPGDVLVAPTTTPPWSMLFLAAGAVVTDGGGLLSHTAIIAREYGIPAVLATGEATRRLHDGDLVNVDGTAGVVTIDAATRTGSVNPSAAGPGEHLTTSQRSTRSVPRRPGPPVGVGPTSTTGGKCRAD